ncbi:MAG TPA: hypothetical protein VIX81_03055 [Gammaproteobacteria bacterium]
MARTTISLPDDLKRRMEAVEERVNWSAVATEAFAAKLHELGRQRRDLQLEEVIERLRQTRDREAPSEYRQGYAAGREWAMRHASYAELGRLKRLYDWWEYEPEYDLDWFIDNVGQDTRWSAPQYIAFEILALPESERAAEVAEAFWHAALAGAAPPEGRSDFLEGFVKGAVELYAEVAGAL